MITFTYPDTDTGAGITAPASEDDLERSDAALSDWLEEQWSSPAWRWERLMAQTGDPPPHDSDALLRRIEDAEALVTHLQARQARDLAALRAVRLADQRAAHGPAPASSRVDPDGWVPSEVGFALGLSEAQVRRRLAFAAGLDRYRHLARLVDDGGVVAWTAHSVVEHLDALSALVSPARLEVVESACVAWLSARPRTVAALNRRMRRLVLQARIDAGLDGDGIVGRGHADRRVSVATRGDGCAELWAWLPEADALAVAAALDLAAPPSAQMPSEEPRTRAQRRADVLVAAVTGAPAIYGSADDIAAGSLRPGPVAVIEVTVPVDTVAGVTTQHGETSWGPVHPQTVTDLGNEPGTTHRAVLFERWSGALVATAPVRWVSPDEVVAGYDHPPWMERLLQARDRTCRAPGCHRRAEVCDADHVTRWPAGPTSLANACCLCRYHHRLKTHAAGWRVTIDGEAALTWRSPTGRETTTDAADHRPVGGSGQDEDEPPF